MERRPKANMIMTLMCVGLLSCGGDGVRSATDSGGMPVVSDADGPRAYDNDMTGTLIAAADSVLAGMTLEERVGQCFMPSIYARDDTLTLRRLSSYICDLHVGGVLLLKGDLVSAARMAGLGHGARHPLFMAMDAEWGLGMRLTDAPDFPRNGRISRKAGEELLFDYGAEVARECNLVGIDMVMGPVIDVSENPEGVIGSRSFGGDPVRVADLGVAYARGLESGGVMSVAKHFPGHGSPAGDSHMDMQVIHRSLHQLDSVDLYPFRSYVDAGLSGVMVGHLAVPAIDPVSLPASFSPVVIGDLLRDELGFRGLVFTDAINMGGAQGYGASEAIKAGADIVVAPENTENDIREVIEAVRYGRISEELINDRCRRILFNKMRLGLWSKKESRSEELHRDVSANTDSLYRKLSE